MSRTHARISTIGAIALLPLLLAGCSTTDGPSPSPSATKKAAASTRTAGVQECMQQAGFAVDGDELADPASEITVPKGADPADFNLALAQCAKADPASGGDAQAPEGEQGDAPAAGDQE